MVSGIAPLTHLPVVTPIPVVRARRLHHVRGPAGRRRGPLLPAAGAPIRGLALLAVLAAPALPGLRPLAAQTVVGTVVERGTARPLAGAFVVLVDGDGRRRNGGLTGEDGGYQLRAAAPGRYRLLAELIGYASATTGWIELAAGASVRHDIEVRVEAVTLEGIEVETGERCRRRPGAGPETARLWEEARKALEVARWSEDQGILRFRVVEHERTLDARTLRVLEQQERGRSGYYDRSPYRSIPPERLHEGGYIQRLPDQSYAYFAPDADVLLSESFLETHCFGVVDGRDEERELIGLAFEPVPERKLPDVRGVLWLEKGSAELRRLDYTYQNLPFRHGDWPQVGGRVELERLATGMWIVRRWRIRMPLEAESTDRPGRAGELELVRLLEQGAEIRGVTTRGGTVIAEAVGATLYGVVTEGPGGRGVPGLTVEIAAAGRRTTTSADGAYRLTGLPSGKYRVRVHPDSPVLTGPGPEAREVELVPGRATRLVLRAPPPESFARRPPVQRAGSPGGPLAGRVLDQATRHPVEGATVSLADSAGRVIGTMVTDRTGAFRLLHGDALGSGFVLDVRRPGYAEVHARVRPPGAPPGAEPTPGGVCRPALWIDGTLLRRGGPITDREEGSGTAAAAAAPAAPSAEARASADVVDAIDVYMSPAPGPGARETGACGVVVMWSREG